MFILYYLHLIYDIKIAFICGFFELARVLFVYNDAWLDKLKIGFADLIIFWKKKNEISLLEHDFLKFMYFWNCLGLAVLLKLEFP